MGTVSKKRGTATPETSIVDVLTREHKLVDKLMAKIEENLEGESFDEVPEVFEILKTKLTAHARGEEMKVYPAFRAMNDEIKDMIGEANEEHALVHDKLAELSELEASDDEFKAKFTVLKDLVQHHVEEEEGELFPEVRKAADEAQLVQLTAEYMEAKREVLGDKVDEVTEIELEVMTKDDLMAQAKEMGVQTTSSMTKAQLVEAMRQ
jgi:hemerythrin superfamily protein